MNKINWFFFQWFFLIVKPAYAPDVTLVLQHLESSGLYNITCVLGGKNLNSGIAWIPPDYNINKTIQTHVSKYVPASHEEFNCNIDGKEECNSQWTNHNWKIGHSSFINFDSVTDNRWDEFKIIYTNEDLPYKNVYNYSEHKNKLTINFSIRIQDQANIFLCNNINLLTSDCYWILIGVEQATIRKCMKHQIDYYWVHPSVSCAKIRASIKIPNDKILSISSWNHFKIIINGRNIVLKLVATDFILLNYSDYEYKYISTDYLNVRSFTPAYWKFHYYEFTYTNNIVNEVLGPAINIQDYKFCISLYVTMCLQCSLIINTLQASQNLFRIVANNTKRPEFQWQELKWDISLSTLSEIRLQVETKCDNNSICNGQFWAIDNFRLCQKNEVRVLNVEENGILSSFQIVDSQLQNINIPTNILQPRSEVQFPDSKCPIDTVGSTTCARCSDIFDSNKEFCQGSIICDLSFTNEGICKCSPGYSGKFCQIPCSYPYYGSDCKQKCGLCEHSTNCHFITGSCTSNKCTTSFTDSQCKIPQYPILTNAPIVTDRGNTYIKIKITNFSYYGLGIPSTFKIIYELTGNNNSSIQTKSYSFHYPEEITLHNLHYDTSYTIRVVLVTLQNKFYDGIYVRKIIVNTTCADVQSKDIIIYTTNTSAILSFRDRPELCSLKYYKIYYINLTDNSTRFINGMHNQYRIPNLLQNTEYTLTIENITSGSKIYYTFITNEPVPSSNLAIKYFAPSATSLNISWSKPLLSNEQYYNIYYKHYKHRACDSSEISNGNMVILKHNLTFIVLNDLIPFSEYIIQIGIVLEEEQELHEFSGFTPGTNVPDESEIPTRVNIKPSSTEVEIKIEQANCSLVKGEIEYYISAQCTNNWCLNNRISTLNTSYSIARQRVILTKLLPYSMYNMSVVIRRKNGNVSKKQLSPITFTTLPTAPNAVKFDIYEESEDILRLRITPPYPPTGELEQYIVKYCEVTNKFYYHNCKNQDSELVSCKLWTELHCVDISQDLKGNQMYRVYVQARNKNITTLGPEVYEVEGTKQRSSYAPEELSYSWDNYYNLTLQWKHPYVTNGPLTKFVITLQINNTKCYSSDYMVSNETIRLRYNNVFSIENKDCYTSPLIVTIQSFNKVEGQLATLQIYSPPETPALMNKPSVHNISSTSITIELSAKSMKAPISFMYIILSESKSEFEIGDFEDCLSKLDNSESLAPSWFIKKYNLKTEELMEKLTIGRNNSLQNDAESTGLTLISNTSYTITILMYNEYEKIKRYRVYKIVQSTGICHRPSSSNALYFITLILLLLPLLWIYYRKRKTGRWCSMSSQRSNTGCDRSNSSGIPFTQRPVVDSSYPIISYPYSQISSGNITADNLTINKIDDTKSCKFSKVINVTDFDKYVKKAIINGELERQHSLFLEDQTLKPLDYGYITPNDCNYTISDDVQTENKYEEIDCDQSAEDDASANNYIEGYISKNAYVVTSIPQAPAVNKFWKLIWNDNVKYIVLLSSFMKEEKRNIKQYWPKINETTQYGSVSVKLVSSEIFADYEYRTFLVSSNDVERQVQQLHFTAWPDYGVPMYPHILVPLLKILLTFPESNSPIAIHCSAGMQPIGTIILCDLCLKMAAHEGVIDIIKYLRKIRAQRANLIGSFEQYKFVHLVLLECLIHPVTSITCDNEAENNILSLLESTTIDNQFRYINEVAWQDQTMRPLLEVYEEPAWKEKNRFQNIVPSGHGRVYLSRYPITEKHSNYINAVTVDGFKAPKRFLVTQQPLPNTITDFWRMIDEKEVSTIVSLNIISKENDRSCVFWPTISIKEIRPVPYLFIKFIEKIRTEEITIVKLELQNNKNKGNFKRNISVIRLKNWPADQLMPNSISSLSKVWDEAEKLSQTKHPIVVTCLDGATACGLFIAFTFVIEQIKLEHQCDVCLAVRIVRRNRAQFVSKLEQFKYLYRAAIAHLTPFKLYANISSLQP